MCCRGSAGLAGPLVRSGISHFRRRSLPVLGSAVSLHQRLLPTPASAVSSSRLGRLCLFACFFFLRVRSPLAHALRVMNHPFFGHAGGQRLSDSRCSTKTLSEHGDIRPDQLDVLAVWPCVAALPRLDDGPGSELDQQAPAPRLEHRTPQSKDFRACLWLNIANSTFPELKCTDHPGVIQRLPSYCRGGPDQGSSPL